MCFASSDLPREFFEDAMQAVTNLIKDEQVGENALGQN